jgi:branched-chain amino acid transport system substrate-binding protein
MNETEVRRIRPLLPTGIAIGGLVLSLAACGQSATGSSGPGSGDGLPETVRVISINPETGPAAFAGLAANKGYELAIKEINESDFLDGTTIEMDKADTAASIQTAATEMTKATTNDDYSAVFGSVSSQEAVAQSPIAEKAAMPVIYTQAGSEGVLIGDYTYRVTPLMSQYYPAIRKYLEEQNVKSMGVIYAAWTPTLAEIGEQTVPAIADELGIDIVGSIGTQETTQDFSSPISQLLDKDPDAMAILQVGPANPTAMKQLREAGFDGTVLGNSGASAGNLAPAGEAGAGMTWPADFSPDQSDSSSQKFVELYKKEYGEMPLNYAAEAYDAAWLLARALKEGDSASRDDLQAALDQVCEEGFTGALGDLHFTDNHDLQLPGVVVQWDGTKEVLLYEGGAL